MTFPEKEFPSSWYPLCRAKDLAIGRSMECFAFGEKLAVFRSESGKVGAILARCCHMGADLAYGKVCGENISCPMHHWEFSVEGQCVHIPADSNIPKQAHQEHIQCVEHYGLVFGWLGDDPLFEPPVFKTAESYHLLNSKHIDFDTTYETGVGNALDLQHFRTVHKRELIGSPRCCSEAQGHFGVALEAKVVGSSLYDRFLRLIGKKEVAISVDCWGGNLLLISHLGTPNHMMVAYLPVDHQNTQVYCTTLVPKVGKTLPDFFRATLLKRVLHIMAMAFVEPDFHAVKGMKLEPKVLLPKPDSVFMQWFQYWKQLPRASMVKTKKTKIDTAGSN